MSRGFCLGDRVKPSAAARKVFGPRSFLGQEETRGTVVGFGRSWGPNRDCVWVHFDKRLSRRTLNKGFLTLVGEPAWVEASEGPSGLIPETEGES